MTVLTVGAGPKKRVKIADTLPVDAPDAWDALPAVLAGLPDPATLTPAERAASMTRAAALRNMLDAYLTDLAGVADTAGDSRTLRAGTTATLLAAATNSDPRTASAVVADAAALASMPHAAQAYADGDISAAHVAALRRAAPRIDRFPTLEEDLTTVATCAEPAGLRTLLDQLAAATDPADPDTALAAQRAKRGLHLSALANGMYKLDAHLDAVEGARLRAVLADYTDPPGPDDPRSPAQRRADALADLTAAAARSTRIGANGVSILVDVDTLPDPHGAQILDGPPVGPAGFDLLSCAAACWVIFGARHGDTFVPLAVGRARRYATAAQWAALIARDRGCIRCGKTPRHCQAHHIIHWSRGGLTDIDNLVLICQRCHRDLHHGLYTVTMGSDSLPTITTTRAPPAA